MILFRLIPARAGNTKARNTGIFAHGAHPRSRGEHRRCFCFCSCGLGSSPLARGTLKGGEHHVLGNGLIPARAGNTDPGPWPRTLRWAHPRSRGEHTTLYDQWLADWGSSPLARGTPSTTARLTSRTGLIPARAGNTSFPQAAAALGRAHPRSRGEHRVSCSASRISKGSSPLARGTHLVLLDVCERTGLIPARAGNTKISRPVRVRGWAHPRSRGEHRLGA